MTRKGEDGGWPYEFTPKYVNALEPREKRYEKGERHTKGLRIVVHPITQQNPKARKVWRFTWARGKGVVIGEYPAMTIAMARAECARVLARVNAGEDPRPLSRRPAERRSERLQFRDFLDKYTEYTDKLKAAQGFDNRSVEVLRGVLKDYSKESKPEDEDLRRRLNIGALFVDTLTHDVLLNYRDALLDLGNRPKTINRKIEALRPYYNWGRKHRDYKHFHWPNHNPFIDPELSSMMKPLPGGNVAGDAEIRWISPEDEKRIRKYAKEVGGHFHVAVVLALGTGVRPSELFRIRWRDVGQKTIFIYKSKVGAQRYAEMDAAAIELLKQWRKLHHNESADNTVLGVNSIKRQWNKMRKELRIENTLHHCRHTYVSRQLKSGRNWNEIGQLVGHTGPEMTARYAQMAKEMGVK